MELWIPITIFAAFMQNLRSATQKHLKGKLSTSGATFTRFSYGAPVALLYLAGLHVFADYDFPGITGEFLMSAAVASLAQIGATALLVYLFSFRNFAVGTAFSKTETVQAAIFGIVILGEGVSAFAMMGIVISLVGVVALSVSRPAEGYSAFFSQLFERTALIGIASGALFGVAAISVRAASLSLDGGDFVIRAGFSLACVTVFQTVVMGLYIRVREPGQISTVIREWRLASLVGLTGVLASIGWFTAMTLENAAYVRGLGQIELVFTFAASYLFFGERASKREIAGILLVVVGILVLIQPK
jgi:drug/metabolite transporter (DMT)-like permease